MSRIKDHSRTLLFEELEPRLLFSADVAEPLAAEVVQEQLVEAPVIIVEETAEQQEVPAADSDDTAADIPAATDTGGRSQSDTFEIGDSDDSGNEEIPSEPDTSSAESAADFSEGSVEEAATNEPIGDSTNSIISADEGSESLDAEDASSQRNELVFVNDNVRDIDGLVTSIDFPDGVSGNLEVIILDSGRDGIEQVSEILSTRDELDAIHIITHGRDGQLALGSDWLDSDDLQVNSDTLAAWSESLSEDGDILLYGCSIAAGDSGQDFIDSLSRLTGADVAASDDPTGHDALGGDWDLEYSAGMIETASPLNADTLQNWDQLLVATVEDDFNSGTYGGSTGTVLWNGDWHEIGSLTGLEVAMSRFSPVLNSAMRSALISGKSR